MNILLRMHGFGGRTILTALVLLGLSASPAHAVDGGYVRWLAAWVDGIELPPIQKWEGGDPRVRYSSTAPLVATGIEYAPLTIDFDLAPAPVMQTWLKQFCARQATPHRLVISEINPEAYGDLAMITREYTNPRITEAHWFLSAGNGVTPFVRITFQADGWRTLPRQNPTVAPVAGTKVQWGSASFIEQNSELLVPETGPARFTARMDGSARASYWAWRDAIVSGGSAPAAEARTARFTFQSGNTSDTQIGFRLELGGMQLVRYTRDATPTKSSREADGEFLVESVTVTTEAETAAATPMVAQPATTPFVTSTLTPPTAPPPTAPEPASPETGASVTPPSTPLGATPFAVASGRDPASSATLAPPAMRSATSASTLTVPPQTTSIAVAAKDAGLRDPAQFPRPDGLERQRFDTRSSSTRVDESALYTTKRGFDELLAQYVKMATNEGWTEESHSESGPATDRLVMTYWTRAGATADLRLYGRTTGVEVSLAVTVPRTAK